MGFHSIQLFSLLNNHRNSQLEINPKFQQIHRNVSSLLSQLVHYYQQAKCSVSFSHSLVAVVFI